HTVTERRHPHIESYSFIGAHAQILGNITIGANSKVGANAVVLNDVPAYSTAVGNPARLV
ncbi:MAG TPA: serine acetyltransferase, partial [Leuconostoc mesenteroides]|nr:serine acetyltransferase [Leuconostoc mesenteroides]